MHLAPPTSAVQLFVTKSGLDAACVPCSIPASATIIDSTPPSSGLKARELLLDQSHLNPQSLNARPHTSSILHYRFQELIRPIEDADVFQGVRREEKEIGIGVFLDAAEDVTLANYFGY
jgi:hypothetical protein